MDGGGERTLIAALPAGSTMAGFETRIEVEIEGRNMRFVAVRAREPNWLQLARNLLELWLCDGVIFRKSEMKSGRNMAQI